MRGLKVVDAEAFHGVRFLREPTRQHDVDEWVLGSGGRKLPDLIHEIWKDRHPASSWPRALVTYDDKRCLALWGVTVPFMGHTGFVWLIASKEVERHPTAVHRFWRHEVSLMHERAGPALAAYVYERNDMHIKWLRTLGFKKLANISLLPHTPPIWAEYLRHGGDHVS